MGLFHGNYFIFRNKLRSIISVIAPPPPPVRRVLYLSSELINFIIWYLVIYKMLSSWKTFHVYCHYCQTVWVCCPARNVFRMDSSRKGIVTSTAGPCGAFRSIGLFRSQWKGCSRFFLYSFTLWSYFGLSSWLSREDFGDTHSAFPVEDHKLAWRTLGRQNTRWAA